LITGLASSKTYGCFDRLLNTSLPLEENVPPWNVFVICYEKQVHKITKLQANFPDPKGIFEAACIMP
jgi:hypothetical protein